MLEICKLNASNIVFLKDIEEQPDWKIQQFKNTFKCVLWPWKKTGKVPEIYFLKKVTNPK